ncbi:MAG: hypothetical protein ACLPN5_07455 [Roseiarcus sp.]
MAPATRRGYGFHLDYFAARGGTIPSTDAQAAAYLCYSARHSR